MKKIKLSESQFKLYVEHLKEHVSSVASGSSSDGGGVTLSKRDANPNDIKKYTDKGINVSIIDEDAGINENDFLKSYFHENLGELEEDVNISGSFSIEELEMLPTFSKRMAYCKKHLKYLGSGSSRAVFDLNDGEYVLKLAKNTKGLHQNAVEGTNETDFFTILAECKYYEFKVGYVLFVIMEKANKLNEAKFKSITDLNFDEYVQCFYGNSGAGKGRPVDRFTGKLHELVKASGSHDAMEFYNDLQEYIYGTDLNAIGDLARIQNWGWVDREGHHAIVLIDHGINDQVMTTHYK